MVGDLLGYWQFTLFAHVDGDGTLLAGSGVVSSSVAGVGLTVVTFEHDVSDCGLSATAHAAFVNTGILVNGAQVQVFTFSTVTDVDVASPVHLVVDC